MTDGPPRDTLVASQEVLRGLWLQTWAAPAVAAGVRPGQYVYALTGGGIESLRAALPICGFDRARGLIRLHVEARSDDGPGVDGRARLATMRVGDESRLVGPLGHGFVIEPRSLHLLLVADVTGLARVLALVDEAIGTGRRVVLLLGAPSASQVYPSSLLPDEVEYGVATADGTLGHHGDVTDLVGDYEAWADQCFAAGADELHADLRSRAHGRDARMGVARLGRRRGRRAPPSPGRGQVRPRAWLQIALEHGMGCALGTCLGCVVAGRAGPVRACREGPAFAADELREDVMT